MSLRLRQDGPSNGGKGESNPAIFTSPGATYHADRCEPLRAAVRRGEVRLSALVHRGYPGRLMPAGVLPEVSTVGFWDAIGNQTWGLDWHRNEGIELTYLARGRTDFLVDEESFILRSGQLTVTRPWQQHRVGNPFIGSSRLCWLILDVGVRRPDQKWQWPDWMILSPKDLERLTTLLSQNEQPVWPASDEIAACFERLASLVRTREPTLAQTRLRLYINEMFIALRELLEARNIKLDRRLVSTRRSVELFLSSLFLHVAEEWPLDKMAYQMRVGSDSLLQLLPANHEYDASPVPGPLPNHGSEENADRPSEHERHGCCHGLWLPQQPVLLYRFSAKHAPLASRLAR